VEETLSEGLLHPASMSSIEETESPITLAEIAEGVKMLPSAKALDVDKIQPEMLKALDIMGLTRLFNVARTSGTMSLEWQTGVVVPSLRKGTGECFLTAGGITPKRLRPIVEPQIQEKQCDFSQAVKQWTSSSSSQSS